jgi:dolichyl-phosphate beta-glucosyltransferase
MARARLKTVLSITIATALIAWVFSEIDARLTWSWVQRADRTQLLGALLLLVAAYAARAGRWLVWQPTLGYSASAKAVLVGFMGNNILPARLGEVLRADWIAARTPAAFGRTAALASIGAERILDGVVLSLFGLAGLAVIDVNDTVYTSMLVITVLFGALAAALLITVVFEPSVRRLVDRLNEVFPGHLTRFARSKTHYALSGVVRLRGASRVSRAVVMTLVIWLLELACYWMIAASIAPVSIGSAAIFVTVVNFASLFPLTVGGIGAIEGAATAFLVSIGLPADQALAIVLLQHGFQLAFTTVSGAVVYLTNPRPSRIEEVPASVASPEDVLLRTRLSLNMLKADLALAGPVDGPETKLSIVIPAYNERARLPRTALEAIRWCNVNDVQYEIVIVDDGSSDDTLSIAELLAHHDRNVRSIACPHKGKGATVRMGMLNARGTYVLFMDADGATPLTEIPRLLSALESGSDVAIGSRVLQAPGEVVVETSFHRKFIGRTFALLVNILAVRGIGDTQCGFKMFRRDAARAIFSRQQIDGFAFDVELLYIAQMLGFRIVEVPVNWKDQAGSKVNLLADSLKMLWDLSHIRWLHRGQAHVARPRQAQSVVAAIPSESDEVVGT